MFRLINLTKIKTTSHLAKHSSIFVRFNSSSSVGNKVQPNNTATVDNKEKVNETFCKPKIPFMPVINIPEKEFAYNSFFSIYRPLLGLSDENETHFFSNEPLKTKEEESQEKLDTMLAMYMGNCYPFVEPSQLAQYSNEEYSEAYDNAQKEQVQDSQDVYGDLEEMVVVESSSNNNNRQLPVFHMPESADVLDYLTLIESNMKKEYAKLDKQDASRLKNKSKKPMFYASNNRNICSRRPRRYQRKWILKN